MDRKEFDAEYDGRFEQPERIALCEGDKICNHLEDRIGGATFEVAKGLASLFVISKSTGKTSLFAVVYKTGRKDKGLALNYCPWCGGRPGTYERG